MKTYTVKNIKYIDIKTPKNIGLLYKAKPCIDKHSLLSLHHSYKHSHINYGNTEWGSTNRANLEKLYSQ